MNTILAMISLLKIMPSCEIHFSLLRENAAGVRLGFRIIELGYVQISVYKKR